MREIIEKNTGCVLIGVLRSLVGELIIIEKNTGCVFFYFYLLITSYSMYNTSLFVIAFYWQF